MGKHSRTLKTLRNIALEYGSSEQPDLALMARELGCVVHQNAVVLANRLAPLRARQPAGPTKFGSGSILCKSAP